MKRFQWKTNGREQAIQQAVWYLEKAFSIQTEDFKMTKEAVQNLVTEASQDAVGYYNEATDGKFSNNSRIVYDKEKFKAFKNDVWASYRFEQDLKIRIRLGVN
jgi:hypothetical protein